MHIIKLDLNVIEELSQMGLMPFLNTRTFRLAFSIEVETADISYISQQMACMVKQSNLRITLRFRHPQECCSSVTVFPFPTFIL